MPVLQYPDLLEVLKHFHIPVYLNSGISVRPPYPYPESTNPTKLKRGKYDRNTVMVCV